MAKELTSTKKDPHAPILSTENHGRDTPARTARHDEAGRELLSPLPMEPPLGYVPRDTMMERLHAMIRDYHFQRELAEKGVETFEEADDFEVGDDFEQDKHSPYENEFDPSVKELLSAGHGAIKQREAAEAAARASAPKPPSSEEPDEGSSGGAEGGSPKA